MRYLSLIIVTALISGCSLLDPNPQATVNGPSVDTTCLNIESKTGADIYLCKCVSCHKADGAGVTSTIRDIKAYADTASFEEFDLLLSNGRGIMPRYPELGSTLRSRLFEHLKSF